MATKSQLHQLLLLDNTKTHWQTTANWVLDNKAVEVLIELFYSEDKRVSQRASAIFMTLVDIDKKVFLPYQERLVQSLLEEPTTTQKRNIIRLFQFIYIKEEVEAALLNHCFNYLENPSEAIAVRAFSMAVAYRIGERYPEIFPELQALIVSNLEMVNSPGINNRGNKILHKIEKFKS